MQFLAHLRQKTIGFMLINTKFDLFIAKTSNSIYFNYSKSIGGTYIHRPGEGEVLGKIKSLHIKISHSTVII